MIGWLKTLLCAHKWADVDYWNVHRNVDNVVVGIATRQRCERCGTYRMKRVGF